MLLVAVILICGVPGSGKTTLAFSLAHKLQIEQVIQTDTVKTCFLLHDYPAMATTTTHGAWRLLGKKSQVLEGLRKHTKYFEDFLLQFIQETNTEGKTIIIEGIHATPKLFSKISGEKIAFYLTICESERKKRCVQKNKRRFVKNIEWFDNAQEIQIIEQHLLKQAAIHNMQIIQNDSYSQTIKKMMKEIQHHEH